MTHEDSASLKEIYSIKEECYLEVSHLPITDALRKRIQDAALVTRKAGFSTTILKQPSGIQ
jgi:hypothetical protein